MSFIQRTNIVYGYRFSVLSQTIYMHLKGRIQKEIDYLFSFSFLSFFFFLLFIALCVGEQYPLNWNIFLLSYFFITNSLAFLNIKRVQTYTWNKNCFPLCNFQGAFLEYLSPMIIGYFHIRCHFKVKNVQGQSHHLSSTGFPDTRSCSEMASGLLHNKDLAPCHCLFLDLSWESFKRLFPATISGLLLRGRVFKRKKIIYAYRKFEMLRPYI